MIDIDLEAISNNAPKRFEEFEVAIKETLGITFPEKDKELFKQVFCSGYWRALNEIIETIEAQKCMNSGNKTLN